MIRRILFAAVLPTLFAAACSDDAGTITPTGPHHHFVVNKAFIPKNSAEARMYGLDVDGKEGVDNQLGMVLGTLAGQGFDIQTSIDSAVNEGSIALLVNLQSPDYKSGNAGVQVHLANTADGKITPAPCTDPNMPATCGQHLKGTGMFEVTGMTEAAIAGKIVNGTFIGGSATNNVTLQISLAGATVELDLIGARAQLSGMSDDKIDSAIVAGAVTKDDLDNKVIPAIQMQLGPIVAEGCGETALDAQGNPAPLPGGANCTCRDGATGKQIQSLFDTMPKDCMVTVDEIKNNGLIQSLLAPDVTIAGQMALSIGLKTTAVKGIYTVAGEE